MQVGDIVKWEDVGRWLIARKAVRRILGLRGIRRFASRTHLEWIKRLVLFSARRDVFGMAPSGLLPVVIVVSHELSATGAPKMLVEVIAACRDQGWDVVVVAPADGPYRSIFAQQGAFVIVAPEALQKHSMVTSLVSLAHAAICNTVVTVEVVKAITSRLPVAWYLHENAMIAAMTAADKTLIDVFRSVRLLWATSQLTAATLAAMGARPEVLTGCCAPLVASRAELPPINRDAVASFVLLGSVESRKGQDLLLDAIELLRPETRAVVRFTLYGKVLDIRFHEALLNRLVNFPEVRYAGAITPQEAIAAVIGSDVVIIPSRDEPLSLAAAEGLSAGRIVICSKRCGVSDYLVDTADSFIASDCGPVELAESIETAMDRRVDWGLIGIAGRAAYDEHFSTKRFRAHITRALMSFNRNDG